MMKENDEKLIDRLNSDNSMNVINAIQDLRQAGTPQYIPVLVELFHSTSNKEIKQKILTLLSDLKDIGVIPELIEAIQNKKYSDELRELVSICWENGLDFSQYLNIFVDLVIDEDFLVAFEAFTVIENMAGNVSDGDKEEQIEKIKRAVLSTNEDKESLLMELIEIIPLIKIEE